MDRAVLAGDPLDLLVQLDRVLLEPGDVRVAVERVHPAGRVPRRAGRQLAPLEEHDVGPARLRQVVQHAGADDAATDDDDLGSLFIRLCLTMPIDASRIAYSIRANPDGTAIAATSRWSSVATASPRPSARSRYAAS